MLRFYEKFKLQILITLASLLLFTPAALPLASYAASCTTIDSSLTGGINGATGGTTVGTPQDKCNSTGGTNTLSGGIKKLAAEAVNIFSVVVGAVSVIMIIYGGFKYITSGGESNNVSGAKNTLIYAIVGLFIVAIAQLVVHYVLNTAASVG